MAQLPLTFADICRYFGAKTAKKWPKTAKTTKNRQNKIFTDEKMVLCNRSFFGTFWQNLKKSTEQSPKNPKMTSKNLAKYVYLEYQIVVNL